MSRRPARTRVLGTLLLCLGAAGCGTDASAPPAAESQAPSTPTAQEQSLSNSDVCVQMFFWGRDRKLCKPLPTSIDTLLADFRPLQEGMCNQEQNAELRQQCLNKSPYVFVPKGNPAAPLQWISDVESVQSYFRLSMGASMTIYEESLSKMADLASEMTGPSEEELKRRRTRITERRGQLGEKLKARAAAEQGTAKADLAEQRELLSAYEATFNAYQSAVQALAPAITDVYEDFVTYRGTEAAVFAQLEDIAQRASTSTIAQMGPLQLELVTLARTESQRPQALWMESRRLGNALSQLQTLHQARLAHYADFTTRHAIPQVNLTERSGVILNNIAGYSDARYARVAEVVKKLLQGLTQRQTALVAAQADLATRQTMANAATLKASQEFLASANARTTALWQLPPRSQTLNLFFLATKHVDFESILQLEPLCLHVGPNATGWMESGCIALRRQFTSARNYLNTTLPNMVRLNVTQMRRAGVNEALLVDVETHLNNGNLRQAVLSHDVALRASDL
ncbi:hypothetical protein SAMN05443572_112255 [Myxococcus fulvus]|uniref:Lipoprotein n=2 Tax=Myxococcus fulvus TaxID=33 RepID=A0ABY1CU10_MYXFU|nr:hypothetical protein [Myxococcus fulvus]SEU37837.1 hypothetical protein SAMN05443572_112255 [Myxococcus fulvus]